MQHITDALTGINTRIAAIITEADAHSAAIAKLFDERDRLAAARDTLAQLLPPSDRTPFEADVRVTRRRPAAAPDDIDGQAEERDGMPTLEGAVLRELLTGSMRTGEVAANLKADHADVRETLQDHEASGNVTVEGKTNARRWSLTPKGRRLASKEAV
jgi:hypothetical protein